MFFRRDNPKPPTFAQRIDKLRSAGFSVTPRNGGVVRVERGGYGVDLRDDNGAPQAVGGSGIVVGDEIAVLVDGGYQKFFRTPSGRKLPALAEQLKALHDLDEDLKEALGEESYYNESLGTVSTLYLYDRVKDRDRGVPRRVWE
jgi:hypothetical protein